MSGGTGEPSLAALCCGHSRKHPRDTYGYEPDHEPPMNDCMNDEELWHGPTLMKEILMNQIIYEQPPTLPPMNEDVMKSCRVVAWYLVWYGP